jgi:aquaporin Z
MKKYLTEFIGTFFLLLTVALTGNPIAIGAVLAALVYMGGYISGAHYNPAVTLAVLIRGKISPRDASYYVLSQCVAGAAAAIVYFGVKGEVFVPHPAGDGFVSTLVEILFTFLLASVVLHVAATEKTEGNHYYGIAIGAVLMAAAFAGGPISGGVFNPALVIGPALVNIMNLASNLSNLAIYLVGPLTGGALAAVTHRYLSAEVAEVSEELPAEEYPDAQIPEVEE